MSKLGKQVFHWTLSDGSQIGVQKFEIEKFYDTFRAFDRPILHIGSKATVLDKNKRWRELFGEELFVGIDLELGDNVDHIFDMTGNISKLRKLTGISQFGTIICPHVLEHVVNPFDVSINIRKLLKPGGRLFVCVPWVQGFHEFPDDYWRISFSGLKKLFPNFVWETEYYSNAKENIGFQLTYNGNVEHTVRTCRIERNLFQFQMADMPKQDMFDDYAGDKIALSNQYMPAMSINGVGVKQS